MPEAFQIDGASTGRILATMRNSRSHVPSSQGERPYRPRDPVDRLTFVVVRRTMGQSEKSPP